MPGMPVFQDSPSQLKGQIYVLKGTTVAPLEVDTSGNLTVAGNVGLETGTTVGLAAGTEAIGTVGLASGTTVGLAAGTEAIGTVGLTSGTTVGLAAGTEAIGTVGLASGTTVGLSAGTKVQNDLVFTNVDSFGAGTVLTSKDVGIGATVNADSQDISVETSYNWFIKNTGVTSSDQDITLIVELSPDGGTNWIEDTGVAISVPFNTSKMITVNNFLQNARFVITGGVAATTVISCFQAQH